MRREKMWEGSFKMALTISEKCRNIHPSVTLAIDALAVEKQFYVISDEIYEKLIYDGEAHVSIASLGDEIRAQTIVVNGVSKSYAMTGWRIGYAAGPKAVIRAMTAFQSHSTSNPNSIAQHAAAVALTNGEKFMHDSLVEFDARRRLMHQPAARVEFHEGVVHELFAVGERHRGGVLGDGVRVAGGMALKRRHGADDGLGARGVADAPAGHGVGLGNAVDHDRLRANFVAQRSDGNVRFAVVNQLLIDFVGDDVKLLFHRQRVDGQRDRRMNVSAFFRDCQSHFERPFPHFLPTHIMPQSEENCKIKYGKNSKMAFVSKEIGTHRIRVPFSYSICFGE